MDFDGPGFGWGGGFGWFWQIGSFLFGLAILAAIVLVAVLLVRYLLVATRAHQLYLDTHRPAAPASTAPAPAAPAAAPAPAASPVADPTPPNVPAGTKPTRTRAPKPPTAP